MFCFSKGLYYLSENLRFAFGTTVPCGHMGWSVFCPNPLLSRQTHSICRWHVTYLSKQEVNWQLCAVSPDPKWPSVNGGSRQVELVHLASILKVLHMKGSSNNLARVKYTNDLSLNLCYMRIQWRRVALYHPTKTTLCSAMVFEGEIKQTND